MAAALAAATAGLIGINVGANKDAVDRTADYVAGIVRFAALADYFTLNVSSPNTPGLRALRRGVEGAQAGAQASAAELAAARLSAQGELATDYFALRAADAQIALTRSSVEGYERSLKITRDRYAAAIAAKTRPMAMKKMAMKKMAMKKEASTPTSQQTGPRHPSNLHPHTHHMQMSSVSCRPQTASSRVRSPPQMQKGLVSPPK